MPPVLDVLRGLTAGVKLLVPRYLGKDDEGCMSIRILRHDPCLAHHYEGTTAKAFFLSAKSKCFLPQSASSCPHLDVQPSAETSAMQLSLQATLPTQHVQYLELSCGFTAAALNSKGLPVEPLRDSVVPHAQVRLSCSREAPHKFVVQLRCLPHAAPLNQWSWVSGP